MRPNGLLRVALAVAAPVSALWPAPRDTCTAGPTPLLLSSTFDITTLLNITTDVSHQTSERSRFLVRQIPASGVADRPPETFSSPPPSPARELM